ncbi:hypothetical protein BGZ83_008616 [Gryganskiella cystojenkinii]|nr:hypothetical protein BGZ83_008616 [Gryganskiella cystojenkinii]
MLPEVKALMVSPYISNVVFKVNPDYTIQHTHTPKFYETAAIEQLSEEGQAEMYSIRIVQEPVHYDSMDERKVYIRLLINDETVGTMLTAPYDDIPYVSVMASMRMSLLKGITIPFSR